MSKWFFVVVALGTLAPSVHGDSPVPSTGTVVLSSACTANPWKPAENKAFPEREHLSFVIRWGVITAGRAEMSVEGIEMMMGRPAYHLKSYAHSTGFVHTFYRVKDHSSAWLDKESLITLRYDKQVKEGKYHIEESAEIDQVCGRFKQHSYRIDKQRTEDREGAVPPGVRDVFGSLYYVRTLPLEPGASYTMDVLSGDKLWPLVVNVKRRETVKVPAGKFDCIVVEPVLRQPGIFVAKGKKMEVWLTADERRMPVRMRSEVVIGHVAAELTHAQ